MQGWNTYVSLVCPLAWQTYDHPTITKHLWRITISEVKIKGTILANIQDKRWQGDMLLPSTASQSLDGLKSSDQPFHRITGSVVYHLLYPPPHATFVDTWNRCGRYPPKTTNSWFHLKKSHPPPGWKRKIIWTKPSFFVRFHPLVFSGVSVAVKCKLKIMSLTVSKHLREHITIFERGNPYILRLLCPSSPLVWNHQLPSTSHHPKPKPTWLGCTLLPAKTPPCFLFSPVFCV